MYATYVMYVYNDNSFLCMRIRAWDVKRIFFVGRMRAMYVCIKRASLCVQVAVCGVHNW